MQQSAFNKFVTYQTEIVNLNAKPKKHALSMVLLFSVVLHIQIVGVQEHLPVFVIIYS